MTNRKSDKSQTAFGELILPVELTSLDKPAEPGPVAGPTTGGAGAAGSGPAIPDSLPILPVRGQVIFPGTVMPLVIGRAASRQLLDENLPKSKIIGVITQREEQDEEPGPDQLYRVGTAAMVLKLIRQPDDSVSLIIHGLRRIQVKDYTQIKPYLRGKIEQIFDIPTTGKSFLAAVNQLRESARQLIEMTPNAPEQALTVLMNIDEPGNLADFLAANLNLDIQAKQDLLEEPDIAKRLRLVHHHVSTQLEIVKLQQKIQQDVQSSIGDSQRQYYLREQLKAIQKELGEDVDPASSQLEQLREKILKANPPAKVIEEAERELGRLANIPPASPEHSLILTYLELIAGLPWSIKSQDNLDLDRARKILDRDHFDLDKVKRRLVEYLAVRKLNPEGRGPILCLIGPPGVGKTSLGQSIADALGRKFARLSFGGIRDEAEIRGHRRTYIGAMPGRIVQELRRAGTSNPVMMLDEIDKLGSDFRGDPASALLEVLDPRQNHGFVDRYLDLPYDLSQVMFIATANYVGNIPPALLDRMEIIDIPGYTEEDKLQIAQRYLVPRQLKENGLTRTHCLWTPSGIRKVIEDYTREAGVRELERQIGSVCRSVAAEIAQVATPVTTSGDQTSTEPSPEPAPGVESKGKKKKPQPHAGLIIPSTAKYTVDAKHVRKALGAEKFFRESEEKITMPGLVIGLAYTPVGGEILFIEATIYPGKGGVILTGQIGDVMKESATAALSLFKSRAQDYGFDSRKLAESDLHIHVPAGAVPKDGPSAGIAMYTAIASLLLNKPVRQHLAMTGEITLRGRVMPIGGVKEKTLAAMRAGVRIIVLPEENRRDMEEIHPLVKKRCEFKFVSNADEVLQAALGVDAVKIKPKKPAAEKKASFEKKTTPVKMPALKESPAAGMKKKKAK